jgi:glycosyltransferase involved in cell wall biosynthesis
MSLSRPPVIARVPDGTARPLWSVMIPTYNCANFLRETLQSVLAQAPDATTMQIEVVDDCSTRDDPTAVVQELGQGRVSFFRQPANVGATANFNTCIARARGELVHILHGDDLVEPTFYSEIGAASARHTSLALFACRSFVINGDGSLEQLSPRYASLETPTHDARALWYDNYLPTPGVVVRRRFYEEHHGFRTDLCHVADWEMWWRAITFGGGLHLNRPLARYRMFGGNDTSRLARSAENLRDYLRLGDLIAPADPQFDPGHFRATVARRALEQSLGFASIGDRPAAIANIKLWWELATWKLRVKALLRHPRAVLRRFSASSS